MDVVFVSEVEEVVEFSEKLLLVRVFVMVISRPESGAVLSLSSPLFALFPELLGRLLPEVLFVGVVPGLVLLLGHSVSLGPPSFAVTSLERAQVVIFIITVGSRSRFLHGLLKLRGRLLVGADGLVVFAALGLIV